MKSMIFTLLLAALSPTAWAVDTQSAEVGLLAQRDHAEALRNEAKDIRQRAEEAYSLEDAECSHKILVNACRDSARERYLKEVTAARTKEIEANRIDTEAKKALNRLHESELKAKQAHQSATREKSSRSVPKPVASDAAASAPVRDAPPPLSAEKAAKFEAEMQKRKQEAEVQHAKEAAQAKIRAAKAKEDAARYDARAREVAERKAKRAGQSAPASSSITR